MAQNPDFEVHGQVTLDNSDVKEKLDETQTKAEDAAKDAGDAIGEAADDSSDKVKKKSRETKDQLEEDFEETGKKAEGTAEDTTEKVKKQFEAGSVAIGNIISGLVSKIADAGKNLISQGIEYNASIEKYRTGLTNMLGDAEQANAALENIKQDAARTPFDTDSLVKANQYLIGAGENAEYSRKTILALGDAVSATGGTSVELERMAQNLQQIANVGEASAVDIKQFAFAGINIYQVLADYTGKTVQEVQDMTITYDVLTQALQAAAEEGGRYYNSMQTQSETFTGSLNTLKDNVTQLLGSVTEGLSSGLGEWMRTANEAVVSLNDTLQNEGAQAFFESGAAMIGSVIQGFADKIPDLISKSADALSAVLGYFTDHMDSVVTVGGTIIANIVTGLVDNLPKIIEAAGQTLSAFLAKIIENLPNILTLGGNIVKKLCEGIGGSVQVVVDAASTIATSIAHTLASVNWFDVGVSIIKEIGRGIYNGMQSVTEAILSLDGSALNTNSGISKYRVGGGYQVGGGAGRQKKTDISGSGTNLEEILSSLLSGGSDGSSGGSSGGSSSSSSGSSSTSQKARQVKDTVTDTKKTVDGSIKTITKTFDDGTKQITTTTTKAGKEIVDGVERNVTTVTTKVDEFATETSTVAKETSTTIQKEIEDIEEQAEKSLSEVEKELKKSLTDESSNGIIGILKSSLTDLKNKDWSGIALNVVKLIWGEVDQEQRNVVTEWAGNVLKAINQEYASGGLSAAFNAAKTLLTGGELTLGETTLSSIGKIVTGLTESGGMGEVLGSLVTQLGSGFSTLAANIGSVGTALSGLATKIIGVVAANPEIFAILAIAAGAVALGAYIWKKHGKDISNWWGGLWDSKSSAVSADNYRQSDSITAAQLVQESQAAAAANRQSVSSVQNGTGSAAAQQLNASWRGTSTVVLNLDGREVARTTAPYMDEELEFRS